MATTNGVNGVLKGPPSSLEHRGQRQFINALFVNDSPNKDAMESFLDEVQHAFASQLDLNALLHHSQKLQTQLRQHLKASEQCMLPSFNYNLPTGKEQGLYLALEVGGSNLRIAMVELGGRQQGSDAMRIMRIDTCPITFDVKLLPGDGFFKWMAERVKEMLQREGTHLNEDTDMKPLHMGVAWSFPIESVLISNDAAE